MNHSNKFGMPTMPQSLSILVLYMNGRIIWSPLVLSMAFHVTPASKTWDIVYVLPTQDVNITMKGKSYLGSLYAVTQRTIHLTGSQ